MKKKLTALLAATIVALGLGLASAPAASAHPYVNGCQSSHTSAGYRNNILGRIITEDGTTDRVQTRWLSYNFLTKQTHYHNTDRQCFRPGLGF